MFRLFARDRILSQLKTLKTTTLRWRSVEKAIAAMRRGVLEELPWGRSSFLKRRSRASARDGSCLPLRVHASRVLMTTHELEHCCCSNRSRCSTACAGTDQPTFPLPANESSSIAASSLGRKSPGLSQISTALIEERTTREQAAPILKPNRLQPPRDRRLKRQRPHKAEEHGHHEPPVSLHEWLSGLGDRSPSCRTHGRLKPGPLGRNRCRRERPDRQRKTYVAIGGHQTSDAGQPHRDLHVAAQGALQYKFTEFSRLFGPGQVESLTAIDGNMPRPPAHHDHGDPEKPPVRCSGRRNRRALGHPGPGDHG